MEDFMELLKEKWEDEVIEQCAEHDIKVALTLNTLIYLKQVGFQIRLARKRRKYSMQHISETAQISRTTLWKAEKGDPTVSIGVYAAILSCFGLESDLLRLAKDDVAGRKMMEASLARLENNNYKNYEF